MKRYYFWRKFNSGWLQTGYSDGYSSIKECKKDNLVSMGMGSEWLILKAIVIEKG